MESVKRRNSCKSCTVFVLSLLLVWSPALSVRSSRVQHDQHLNSEDQTLSISSLRLLKDEIVASVESESAAGFGDQDLERKEFSRANAHERKLLLGKETTSNGGLEVQLLHRHHPGAGGAGGKLSQGELLADRILVDRLRQMMQKDGRRAKLSRHFPELEGNDSGNPSDFEFLSPEVSGSAMGSGQYFIDFYFGTPAQKFSLIADTGSDVIWVQCAPCSSCYSQVGPLFSPTASSTYSALTCTSDACQYVPPPKNSTCNPTNPGVCDYSYSYSDGSQSIGVFSTETATMNLSQAGKNVRINDVAFGCGFANEGPSLTAAGGVIGLGQGLLSFPSQISGLVNNTFSYCLVNYLDAPTISSMLVFGDAINKAKQQLEVTPFITNQYVPSLYYVGIQCVSVGGKELSIPSQVWKISPLGDGGTIVDSGTTLTIFLEPAYYAIVSAFQAQISCYPHVAPAQGLAFCFDTSSAGDSTSVDNLNLPSLSIRFQNGAVFNPPNDNIYVPVATSTYCLAIQGSTSPFGVNVLGNLIQQNFEVAFDRQNQIFAFAPAQCSSL